MFITNGFAVKPTIGKIKTWIHRVLILDKRSNCQGMKAFLIPTLALAFFLGSTLNPQAIANESSSIEVLQSQSQDPITIDLIVENDSIQPGSPFWVLVDVKLADGWHSYWKNPGDAGMPAQIEWQLPEGFTADTFLWPSPTKFEVDAAVGFGYDNEMPLLVRLTPPKTLALDQPLELAASVRWLVCSDSMCLPGNTDIKAKVLVKNEEPHPNTVLKTAFAHARRHLPKTVGSSKAQKSGDQITLSVKVPDDQIAHFTKAYFCPEIGDHIDHKAPIQLIKSDEQPGLYTVSLKETNPSEQPLSGILVLHDEANSKVSVAIDTPIETAKDAIIAYVSKPGLSSGLELQEQEALHPTSEFEGNVGLAIAFAFLGGMLLNLMPCVLPVISLKIFSFVKMAGQSRGLTFKHGLAFSLGVVASFWVLASALLGLQAYGNSVGWGFQLQEPIFVAILTAVMFVLGLSLFGLMEIGTGVSSLAGNIAHKTEGLTSSFLSGVLATAVATPCTGPFLGSAVGFAVTQPAIWAMLIFTALGAGMAFPYLVLSAFPALLRFVPKPGNWMVTFKELMGFIMMATTLWLLWVFSAQTSTLSVVMLLGALFFLSIACWIYGKWGTPFHKRTTRQISYVFSLSALALSFYTLYISTTPAITSLGGVETASSKDAWEPFSPERVAELRSQGVPVFIDFTAKWCLICQANHMVLSGDSVAAKLDQKGVVRMKADWTKNDPVITAELKKFGRNSVPLYVLYGAEEEAKPSILPQVLTPDVVSSYLNDISGKGIGTKN